MFGKLKKPFSFLSMDMAIDLGTANSLVYVKDRGIIINEPSVVAVNNKTGQILAIGEEAKKMVGRTPSYITATRPLVNGVISDFEVTEQMLKYFMEKAVAGSKKWFGFGYMPRVIIGIPCGVTEVERRAVHEAALSAGARAAFLIEEPMAAAIGAGLPVDKAEGQMIIDIGGGTSEIGVISLSGLVLNKSLRVAGDELTEAVINFARSKYSLLLGESTAEEVKIAVGSAYPLKREKEDQPLQTVVRGRSLETGLPKSLKFTSIEVREALMPVIHQILSELTLIIEETPPEIVSDILEKGLVMAGGGSLIRGLDKLISEETGMPVWVTENPMEAVVRGCAKVLEDDRLLKKVRVTGGLS